MDRTESNTLKFWDVLALDFDLARLGLVSRLLSRKSFRGVFGTSMFNTCASWLLREVHVMPCF